MKKIILLSGFIISISLFFSCSKDDDQPEPAPVVVPTPTPTQTSDPCNGDPGFCMDYGSVNKSGSAKLFVYNSSRVRVYWENGSGNSFEQVEFDINSLNAGTYNIDGTAASLEYFSIAGGAVSAAYGTVIVTTLDTINGVTGTFTATMQDSTKITNGKFTSIVK